MRPRRCYSDADDKHPNRNGRVPQQVMMMKVMVVDGRNVAFAFTVKNLYSLDGRLVVKGIKERKPKSGACGEFRGEVRRRMRADAAKSEAKDGALMIFLRNHMGVCVCVQFSSWRDLMENFKVVTAKQDRARHRFLACLLNTEKRAKSRRIVMCDFSGVPLQQQESHNSHSLKPWVD